MNTLKLYNQDDGNGLIEIYLPVSGLATISISGNSKSFNEKISNVTHEFLVNFFVKNIVLDTDYTLCENEDDLKILCNNLTTKFRKFHIHWLPSKVAYNVEQNNICLHPQTTFAKSSTEDIPF